MKDKLSSRKIYIITAIIAAIHTLITFISDKKIFMFPDSASEHYNLAITDYCICKILAFITLFALYTFIAKVITSGKDAPGRIFMCALPYLIVIIGVAVIKLPAGFLTNDENVIYQNAITLTHDTWFNYMTTFYYIVTLMIFPFKTGPIIAKLIIEFLVVGYTVFRFRKHFAGKWANLSYLLFLLYPVIAYTTSAHRLPIYFLIYLTVFVKLIFDNFEHVQLTYKNGFFLLFAGAVLTQLRTEGIYLAALIPILILLIYPNVRTSKNIIIMLCATIILQYVISIPQNGLTSAGLDDAANDRMKPFYAYTITNMMRNGLDTEKNKEDLEIVDRYLSLEKIAAINDYYGDINYEDVLILYQDGFVGVRDEATVEDFINYSDALKRIFKNNPGVFLKTRIGAFKYAALPYHIEKGSGVKSLAISIVKSISYNLFIVHIIALFVLIISLIRKRWVDFFVAGGLICHWFIVFILAPASYFKYYFPIFIMAYFYLILCLVYTFSGSASLAGSSTLSESDALADSETFERSSSS